MSWYVGHKKCDVEEMILTIISLAGISDSVSAAVATCAKVQFGASR